MPLRVGGCERALPAKVVASVLHGPQASEHGPL